METHQHTKYTVKYMYANGLLSRDLYDCLFRVVVRTRELDSLAPQLPNVVSYIVEQRDCVYVLDSRLTSCRESRVRVLDAPYVCRT